MYIENYKIMRDKYDRGKITLTAWLCYCELCLEEIMSKEEE